jgi:hypothetical protein
VIRYIRIKLLNNNSERKICDHCLVQLEKYLDKCSSTYGEPILVYHNVSIHHFSLTTRGEYGSATYQALWNVWTFRRLGPMLVIKILSLIFGYLSRYLTDEINTVLISSQPFETVYLPELLAVLQQLKDTIEQASIKNPDWVRSNVDVESFSIRVKLT